MPSDNECQFLDNSGKKGIYSPKRLRAKEMMLVTKPIRENPPIGKNNKKTRKSRPKFPRDIYAAASFGGRIKAKTLEPSRGGMGTKLKMPSRRLRYTVSARI